jgi:hypothetical protein
VSSVVVNLRLSPEDFEATKAKAEAEERSASAVIRRALKAYLSEGREVVNGPRQEAA